MPPTDIESFWEELHTSPNYAVLYYVELLKITLEMIRQNYPKNIYRIKKAVNTLFVMSNETQ